MQLEGCNILLRLEEVPVEFQPPGAKGDRYRAGGDSVAEEITHGWTVHALEGGLSVGFAGVDLEVRGGDRRALSDREGLRCLGVGAETGGG